MLAVRLHGAGFNCQLESAESEQDSGSSLELDLFAFVSSGLDAGDAGLAEALQEEMDDIGWG